MVKESWGKKRTCPKCDTRFYDLNKDPLICPNCEHTFSLESIMEVFKKSPKETSSKKTSAQTSSTDIEDIEAVSKDTNEIPINMMIIAKRRPWGEDGE